MLNFTSGTTGNPKGVKVLQWGVTNQIYNTSSEIIVTENDTSVSYLPSPHVFDQVMFGLLFFAGGRIGYYQGDPLKLTEDCQVLTPTFFPSVPRLFNKIYQKIKASLDGLTGCKAFLKNMAMNSKMYHL